MLPLLKHNLISESKNRKHDHHCQNHGVNATFKMTTAYKDTGKGEAGMEAIKTILDIQASLLTLVWGVQSV